MGVLYVSAADRLTDSVGVQACFLPHAAMTGSLLLHSSSQLASGILPMTAAALLHAPLCGWCCAVQCHENLTFSCRCSMLEIYNEVITDLINPAGTNLQIREDIKRGCYVEDLSEHTVQNGMQHRDSTTTRLPVKPAAHVDSVLGAPCRD